MIDPEGDYATLESLLGCCGVGGEEPAPSLSDVARAVCYPAVSIVVDLFGAHACGKIVICR